MQFLSRICLLVGFVLTAAALLSAGTVQGQEKKKANTKDIEFQTFDGVRIKGTIYPNAGGKRDAVVMLLHSFDLKKGGSSQQPGWADLATSLQDQGFTVLSFDFRGFGDSKNVEKEFWSQQANANYIKRRGSKLPETIDHKDFSPAYVKYLVNDIAAAKAYLDRRNDAKELNASSVVVIGAGEGATLGAMWLANECRRKRDTNMPPIPYPAGAVLAPEAEINDIACGIWLTISPKLGNIAPSPLARWLFEAGKKHKVPMAFVYGKTDAQGDKFAKEAVSMLKKQASKSKDASLTGSYAVPGTKLAGNLLLDKGLDTEEWILKKYLDPVLEARGSKEQKDRHSEASQYWYIYPTNGKARTLSKKAGQESPQVDVQSLLTLQ